ncbi:acetyltransferase (GNAT) family protein [Paenibacillus cellulosilyticus]|uniref:Acetyltransferase (GNAT) family protein n=1 Tax=Paenibacillus cellulosilyticus TaxID=375489 RepID=A0A2V2YLT7_9BACL|nr:GNAT family N-acetyltransferase [Paenibacillus cellulosilyticus]PWV95225.1 acetyltransferase (GNAT) family protein [Paenibacillus cellulosilyticus]QKS46027.1 GNAT family N-acetyltransferase [Paenibacillus cellulosilyticus]
MTFELPILLNNHFELRKAEIRDFAIHYTTYRDNIFFRQSWDRRISIFDEDAPSYWIYHHNRRIGGVCMEPNLLSSFFLAPPYEDAHSVFIQLKERLILISDSNKPIHAYGILPYQTEHFLQLGFEPTESRRVMIRPTESFELQQLGEGFTVSTPQLEHIEQIAELLYHCYSGRDRIGYPGDNTIEQHTSALEYFFEHNQLDSIRNASSMVYDSENNVAAICLISMWEDWPLISNVAVLPSYRGKRIATHLIKSALNELKDSYEVLRLFVTLGNPAEELYRNLGFYPGLAQTTFKLEQR